MGEVIYQEGAVRIEKKPGILNSKGRPLDMGVGTFGEGGKRIEIKGMSFTYSLYLNDVWHRGSAGYILNGKHDDEVVIDALIASMKPEVHNG